MSGKHIKFVAKPSKAVSPKADLWVKSREVNVEESIKRLTVDLPTSLHQAFKASCARRGLKMADVIRDLLWQSDILK
jgi:hypothetical protein